MVACGPWASLRVTLDLQALSKVVTTTRKIKERKCAFPKMFQSNQGLDRRQTLRAMVSYGSKGKERQWENQSRHHTLPSSTACRLPPEFFRISPWWVCYEVTVMVRKMVSEGETRGRHLSGWGNWDQVTTGRIWVILGSSCCNSMECGPQLREKLEACVHSDSYLISALFAQMSKLVPE